MFQAHLSFKGNSLQDDKIKYIAAFERRMLAQLRTYFLRNEDVVTIH